MKLKHLLLLVLAGGSAGSFAQQNAGLASMTLQQRIERMERLLSADVLMEQSRQNEILREEITSLRELIEQQQYEMESIKQRQRSLYLDMDRRLTDLEAGGGGDGSPVPPPDRSSTKAAVVPPAPVAKGSASASTAAAAGHEGASTNAKQAYSAAFDLLKQGRYASSIKAFEAFLKAYPASQYVDNAQYWLAEANYVSREYTTALGEFQKLIARHPDSSKIPGARLKIGYVYYELKNWPEARAALEQVVKLYPGTSVAKKASERLARMKREGH